MFKSERHLSSTIKRTLIRNPSILFDADKGLETFIVNELSLGHGVADLVISFYKKVVKRNHPLTLHDINVLGFIQRNNLTSITEIASTTRTSFDNIRSSIKRLENEKLVFNKNEKIRTANNYVNYQTNTFAIEIKLKNWKRALEQAYRYRSFAYQSYVFLDEKFVNPALKNKNLFFQYNVGLASVSTCGEIDIHYKPKRGNPFDEKLNMLLNENIVTYHLSCKKVSHASR
jgi:hypothetical protein